jgi:hypothetical protein
MLNQKAFSFGRIEHLRGLVMSMKNRILLSLAILLVDLGVFFLPLTALFLIYILLYNPPWFREFLDNLDKSPEET